MPEHPLFNPREIPGEGGDATGASLRQDSERATQALMKAYCALQELESDLPESQVRQAAFIRHRICEATHFLSELTVAAERMGYVLPKDFWANERDAGRT